MQNAEEPFWDRTLRLIREIWPLGDPNELKDRVQADLSESDLVVLRQAIDACLGGLGGEVSARSRAAELGRAYLVMSATGRRRFLELLALEYGVDNEGVERAIDQRQEITDPGELREANLKLRNLLEAPRTKLLRQFNELHEGVKFLVDLRAELIPLSKSDPELKGLDLDVHRLLTSWFDIGFLDLRRITWDTPAAILEKLIEYESVHAISSWKDLKNRLREDRRCYAFFHPRMPEEPLIFVEVALVKGLSDNVQALLDVSAPVVDPEKADTAIFYSISNCQKGLAGVSFGNFLIKRVVADLAAKLPNLNVFSTLSPIPGFSRWLLANAETIELKPDEEEVVSMLSSASEPAVLIDTILKASAGEKSDIDEDALKQTLLRICTHYLLQVKRGRHAYDKVAHFHLANGAQVERINWRGNLTPIGLEQSASIMVNYLYKLTNIEKNHELYTGEGEIASSSNVRKRLQK